MNSTRIFLFFAALAFSLLLMGRPLMADVVTLVVPTDYPDIQTAIDNAETLATNNPANTYSILVEPGIYIISGITLKSNIPLRGRETARTILTGVSQLPLLIASGVTNVSISNFTFLNALAGIGVGGGSSSVRIRNNVFFVGTDGVGVLVEKAPTTEIVNNTFYQNKFAVSRDTDGIRITNNIFSNNTTNISQTAATENNITFNDFNPDPGTQGPKGTSFIPNETILNPDPLFVDLNLPDFHLQAGSPCIDRGDPSLSDPYVAPSESSNPSDIGAYGGPDADTVPLLVSGLTASSATGPTSATLSWSANTAYNVKGYKVYYGRTSGVYDGTDALVSGVTRSSPIDVGNAVAVAIDNLNATVTVPAAPALNGLLPSHGGLAVNWTAVTGATSYTVHYGIDSTDENTVEGVAATSYTITGLTNGQIYQVAVSAVAQPAYYFAVTAYDDSGQPSTPGQKHESAYSSEIQKITGSPVESGLSNVLSDFPEAVVPYPALSDSRPACFIATAAYGYYSAPEVQALRMFRNRFLLTNAPGRAFVGWYYAHGPAAAAYLNAHPGLKPVVRTALMPLVGMSLFLTGTSPAFKLAALLFIGTLFAYGFRKKHGHTA